MRRYIFLVMFFPLAAMAQVRFGYFNYSELMQKLPEYGQVQADFEELKTRCKMEIERNEQELTRSYVSFLDGQKEFPEPILRKRQKELQDLVDKSVKFRDELKQWLAQARDSLFAPIHAKIDDAVARVCVHNKLAYIVDTERIGYIFVNPENGFDVTEAVLGTIALTGGPQSLPVATDVVATEQSPADSNSAQQTDEAATNDATATNDDVALPAENQ